jgi:hypothetical protein
MRSFLNRGRFAILTRLLLLGGVLEADMMEVRKGAAGFPASTGDTG